MKLSEYVLLIFALLSLKKAFIFGQEPSPERAKESRGKENQFPEKTEDFEKSEYELVPVKNITEGESFSSASNPHVLVNDDTCTGG
jgi:hypothetical protein